MALPVCKYDVSREPGCPVIPCAVLGGAVPKAIVMATVESGASEKENGSDIALAPAAIGTDALPPKDTAVSVVVSVVLPPSERAKLAEFIARSARPLSFSQ